MKLVGVFLCYFSLIVWTLETREEKKSRERDVLGLSVAALQLEHGTGVLQSRIRRAALQWLTELFRADRDPPMAVGVSRLHSSVTAATINAMPTV